MSNFPLYDNLITSIADEDLTTTEKNNFLKTVKKMDENGHELLYMLIKVYHKNNLDDTKFDCVIPYEGKFLKNDIKFDLEKLPNKLKQIINKFVYMHIQTRQTRQPK